MAHDTGDGLQGPSPELLAAFEDAAADLDLELEEKEKHESRMIGVAFAPAAHSRVDVDETGQPESFGKSDEAAIRHLVEGFHSVQPSDVLSEWKNYATRPYYVATRSGLSEVSKSHLQDWHASLGSAQFEEATKGFEPQDPRKVTINNLQIVHLAAGLASATWQDQEVGKDGHLYAGNGAGIVVKASPGGEWRFLVIAKGGEVYTRK